MGEYLESMFVWEVIRVKPWLTVDQWTYMAMETKAEQSRGLRKT